MNVVDIPAYLSRIGYSGSTETSVATLRAIHRAHLFAVPFENLDISLGRKIVTDEIRTLNKVVTQGRGGFCYELNGAFTALRRALGFHVTLLSARVARKNGSEGPEFDHLTLRVDIEQPWLADVGYGDSFLEPLRLECGIEQVDPVGKFRLVRIGDRHRMEREDPEELWKPQYSFSLQSRQLEDFAGMCDYHQTSPESSFTQNRICSRATPDGRITLSGMKLIATVSGQREEKVLLSEDEWVSVLREQFGMEL
jgi:N-hydroxyarylamine O-acetyltransferase